MKRPLGLTISPPAIVLAAGVFLLSAAPPSARAQSQSATEIAYPVPREKLDPHARHVFDAVYFGDLEEFLRACAESPAMLSEPGVATFLLHVACREGRPEIVQRLLESGCDPSVPHQREYPLRTALGWDTSTQEERINSDPALRQTIEQVGRSGRSMLTGPEVIKLAEAGRLGRVAAMLLPMAEDTLARKARIVDLLLAAGATAGEPALRGAIVDAVVSGFDGPVVRRLAAAGADPEFLDSNLRSNALHLACYAGNVSAATALLDLGVKTDVLSFPLPPDLPASRNDPAAGGQTPLMCAIRFNRDEIVALLLARGADPNRTNQRLETALHFAAVQESPRTLRRLLDAGARPDRPNVQAITPLQAAASNGRLENVRALCAAGADLEFCDSAGYTALLWAAEKNHAEVFRFLIEQGANLRAATDARKGAMRVAAAADATQIIDHLLNRNEPVNGFPNDVCTPLHEAASSAHAEAVKLLLARGANPDPVDRGSIGGTPLIWAVVTVPAAAAFKVNDPLYRVVPTDENKASAVIRLLLDAGAAIDAATPRGDTALHVAADNDLRVIGALLLERGARTDLANARRLRPRALAEKRGHTEFIALLDRTEAARARP